MTDDRPFRHLFNDESYNSTVNYPINAAQIIRDSTSCIASSIFKPKPKVQALSIFSRAAKAIAEPIIWDFPPIQTNHPLYLILSIKRKKAPKGKYESPWSLHMRSFWKILFI